MQRKSHSDSYKCTAAFNETNIVNNVFGRGVKDAKSTQAASQTHSLIYAYLGPTTSDLAVK